VTEKESFPHLTETGDVHMVDVGAKPETDRRAVAEALVEMSPGLRDRLFAGDLPKGDALASVRLAGIMGAKQTSALIPLCHPIPITGIRIDVEQAEAGARVVATVTTHGKTGVEMEAMTAVSVAALAMYDMLKGIERGVTISSVRLLHKSGGRTGAWDR
jgi:cyclic pyranopterin phosphate synthase